MTALQIEATLLQTPDDQRIAVAARLIAEYHAAQDDEEHREQLIRALDRKRSARR